MSALAKIHSQLAALIYDIEDEPNPERAREIAHQLRIIAIKYDQQADDACLFNGEKNDNAIQD